MNAYFSRVLKSGLLLGLLLIAFGSATARANIADEIESVPVRDDFGRSENPLATGKFTKANWAAYIGGVWSGGWHGYGTNSAGELSSAFWNQEIFSDSYGTVVTSAKVGTGSAASGQYVGIWLNMPTPSTTRSGYEARFSGVNGSSSNYKVEISKWVSGSRTVLASKEGFSLPVNTTMALTKTAEGTIALWTGSGSTYTSVLSSSDTTYTSGYAGIEVLGNSGTYYDFRAGNTELEALGDGLKSVWCASANSCTAVGAENDEGEVQAQIRGWDGSKWSPQTLPSPPSGSIGTQLAELTCSSSSSCMAVGSYQKSTGIHSLALKWNGTSWSNVETANPSGAKGSRLYDVNCTSASACTAVGSYVDSADVTKTLILSWNGTAWSVVASTQPGGAKFSELRGIDCTSTTWCRAAGRYVDSGGVTKGLMLHWNGSAWSLAITQSPSGAKLSELNQIDCTSSSWCRAVGRFVDSGGVTKTLINGWNGTSWSVVTSPNPAEASSTALSSISCTSSTWCTSSGYYRLGKQDRPLAIHWDGTNWSQQQIHIDALGSLSGKLFGVFCVSTSTCQAAGDIKHDLGVTRRNLAYRYDAGGWSITESGGYARIWHPEGMPTWEVSEKAGASCVIDSNGPFCARVGSLSVAGDIEVPTAAHSTNGNTWTQTVVPQPAGAASARLTGVKCVSRTACRAVGSYLDGGIRKTLTLSWNGSGWSIVSSPNPAEAKGSELSGVDCDSASLCKAVGSYIDSGGVTKTLVLGWNGSSWSVESSPNPSGATSSDLEGISCASSSSCKAAGSYVDSGGTTKTAILSWNGTSWSVSTSPNPSGAKSSRLNSVKCLYSCEAVGSYVDSGGTTKTLALTWTGSEWSVVSSPNPSGATSSQLNSITCSPFAGCIAVGSYVTTFGKTRTLSIEWNGNSWSLFTIPEGPAADYAQLASVTCASYEYYAFDPSCLAVGSSAQAPGNAKAPAAFYFEKSIEWSEMEASDVDTVVEGVSCTSVDDCVAIGAADIDSTGVGVGWVRDEEGWDAVSMPSGPSSWLADVSCTAVDECTAVGDQDGATMAMRWDGTKWTKQTMSAPPGGSAMELGGASCTSDTHCVAVGRQTSGGDPNALAASWDGNNWSLQSVYAPPNGHWSELHDVDCLTSSWCVGVGRYDIETGNRPLVVHWNGSTWSYELVPRPEGVTHARLSGVSCASTSSCVAVGQYSIGSSDFTYTLVWDGARWSLEVSPNPGGLSSVLVDVDCYTAARCVAAGRSSNPETSLTMRWNGNAWTAESVPYPEVVGGGSRLDSLSCTASSACRAVGSVSQSTAWFPFEISSPEEPVNSELTYPPNTTITSPKPSYTNQAGANITFTAGEAGSTFQCSLDGAAYSNCSSPHSLPVLPFEWHNFRVRATDPDGNTDPTPARWDFSSAVYPRAPGANRVISPVDGTRSASHFTLKAKWDPSIKLQWHNPEDAEVTGVTFQINPNGTSFEDIPTKYVRNAKGEEVSWPLVAASSPGETEPIFFDAGAYNKDKGTLTLAEPQFRAVFDGGKAVAGVSAPVYTKYDERWGSPKDAVRQIGPASLNMLTGGFTVQKIDVSIPVPGADTNLEFGRVFDSQYMGQSGTSTVLGGNWQPSIPVERVPGERTWQAVVTQHEDGEPPMYDDETGELIDPGYPAADWAEVLADTGESVEFELKDGVYVSPTYIPELNLRKEGSDFILTRNTGEEVVFTQNTVGNINEYRATSVSSLGAGEARMVYSTPENAEHRLWKIIAPSAPGVTCTSSNATTTKGCRSLEFHYDINPPHYVYDRLKSVSYYNASGNGVGEVVASYAYSPDEYGWDQLSEVWDPRFSPDLKEKYTYDGTNLQTLTPPGEEPIAFDYYFQGVTLDKLKSISRPSLVPSQPIATTTIVYDVPISGSTAPHDMSPSTIRQWGQLDYPVNATAVFPPDEVPTSPPSSYSKAIIYYMDPDGHEVNVASPQLPGASGPSIATNEVNEHWNIVRALTPQARLTALESSNPAERSYELDTKQVFSVDGAELKEIWGPLRQIRLSSGETVEARPHETLTYDEGAPAKLIETNKPHLVTTSVMGARIPGQSTDVEMRVEKAEYDWDILLPTKEIVDPAGLNLRKKYQYYPGTGLLKEKTLPASTAGGDARTTKFVYYTAGGNEEHSECGNNATWANLPCKTMLAAQPTPTEANPSLPTANYVEYSLLDKPTEVRETTAGTLQRTTKTIYDEAGRTVKMEVEGGGYQIPSSEMMYSSTTGKLVGQRFVCKAPENCTGFDAQATAVTYNAIGQQIEYEDADGNKSSTAYDVSGRATVTSDGKGIQAITYDSASGMPIQLVDSAAGAFTASYDADGNLTAAGLPNGLTAETTYDPTGAPIRRRYEKTSNCLSNCTWLDFKAEESVHGQWLKEMSNASVREYTYDKAGRLTVVKDRPDGSNCTTRTYTYDSNSNRTKLISRVPGSEGVCDTSSSGTTQNYTYDTADRLIGSGISYDSLGRITNLPAAYAGGGALTTSFYANDLIRSQTQSGLTNTYDLDAGLRQRSVTQSGTKTGTSILHYSGASDSPSWIESGSTWVRNIAGLEGGLAAIQESSGTVALQLTDLHGDVVATASLDPNATGPLTSFRYDEFGIPQQSSGPKLGWRGAMGRRTELASGVVQMGVRSYIPAMGRFISPDPIVGGSANAYDYGMQDPVNNADLNGEAVSKTPTRWRWTGKITMQQNVSDIEGLVPINSRPISLRGTMVVSMGTGPQSRWVFAWLHLTVPNNIQVRHIAFICVEHDGTSPDGWPYSNCGTRELAPIGNGSGSYEWVGWQLLENHVYHIRLFLEASREGGSPRRDGPNVWQNAIKESAVFACRSRRPCRFFMR